MAAGQVLGLYGLAGISAVLCNSDSSFPAFLLHSSIECVHNGRLLTRPRAPLLIGFDGGQQTLLLVVRQVREGRLINVPATVGNNLSATGLQLWRSREVTHPCFPKLTQAF
jgi:hypothetical protein